MSRELEGETSADDVLVIVFKQEKRETSFHIKSCTATEGEVDLRMNPRKS